jgi:hypothetical protein
VTAAAPVQRRFDLRIATGRPLIGMNGLMSDLNRDEDDVLYLIGERLLQFAFDIRGVKPDGTPARRADVRVFRGSVEAYKGGDFDAIITGWKRETERELDAVIRAILPQHRRPTLRRTEVMRAFNCSGQHVGNLVDAKLLVKVKSGGGINIPDDVSRESVVAFLKARRLPR